MKEDEYGLRTIWIVKVVPAGLGRRAVGDVLEFDDGIVQRWPRWRCRVAHVAVFPAVLLLFAPRGSSLSR